MDVVRRGVDNREVRFDWQDQKNPKDKATALFNEVERILEENSLLYRDVKKSIAMVGRLESWRGLISVKSRIPPEKRISHNAVATAADAVVAEGTQGTPRPMSVTRKGTFKDRRKAKIHTYYFDAKMHQESYPDKAHLVASDAVHAGMGGMLTYRKHPLLVKEGKDEVGFKRLIPLDMVLDNKNCPDGDLKQFYYRWRMTRREAEKRFGKDLIESAEGPEPLLHGDEDKGKLVLIIEAWSLPSYPGAKDGTHVLATSEGVILEEDWELEEFPIFFIHAVKPKVGFWGEMLPLRAETQQYELNKLLRRVQQSMHIHAIPRTWVPRQAKVPKGQLTNDVGVVIQYEGGVPPTQMVAQSMANDVYEHIRLLEQWIYKQMGVSELSATSKLPSNINSGVQQRYYEDVQSKRWGHLERAYERMHVHSAKMAVYFEGQIADKYPKHEVPIMRKRYMKATYWKDIEVDYDTLSVRVYTSSALPNTPGGKLAALNDMVDRQVITPVEMSRMLDDPDFESIVDEKAAPEAYFEYLFEEFLLKGEEAWKQPEPHTNIQIGIDKAKAMLQEAEMDGAEDADTFPIRRWIEQAVGAQNLAIEEEQRKQLEMQQQQMQMEMAAQQQQIQPQAGPPAPQQQVA